MAVKFTKTGYIGEKPTESKVRFTKTTEQKKPKESLLSRWGMEVTPEQWEQKPYQSAIAQTAHEATTIPLLHFLNQAGMNYPRYTAEQGGAYYPEATTTAGRGLAHSAGIAGAAVSPIIRALGALTGVGRMTAPGASMATKMGRGALTGGVTAGAYAQPMEQRPMSATVGAVAGAATGAAMGVTQKIKHSRQIRKEIQALQKEFGLDPKKYPVEHVKTKIGELKKEKGITIKGKADKVNAKAVQTMDSLKAEQKVFDDQLMKKGVDFAKHMKQEGPKWARQGSVKYGQMLDDIGDSVAQGQKLTKTSIVEFLDDTIITLEDRGQTGKVINDLRILRNNYLQEFPTKYAKFYTETVNFGQFKKQMSGVYNQMSSQLKTGVGMTADDAAVGLCKQKWMDLLGTVMPEESLAAYTAMQGKYSKFAQAKKAMGQMFHPYSGKYDLSKGTNTAIQFAEQRKATDINNLMKTLETGIDDFIPGVRDIKVKAQALTNIGTKKLAGKEAMAVIGKAKTIETARLNKVKTDYVDNLFKWEKKASDLSAQQAYIAEQRTKMIKLWKSIGWTAAGLGTAGSLIKGAFRK